MDNHSSLSGLVHPYGLDESISSLGFSGGFLVEEFLVDMFIMPMPWKMPGVYSVSVIITYVCTYVCISVHPYVHDPVRLRLRFL